MANYGIADPCCCERYHLRDDEEPGIMFVRFQGVVDKTEQDWRDEGIWPPCCMNCCGGYNHTFTVYREHCHYWAVYSTNWPDEEHTDPTIPCVPCDVDHKVDILFMVSYEALGIRYEVHVHEGALASIVIPYDEWEGFSQKVTIPDFSLNYSLHCKWGGATVEVWGP